jgi:hypothetical protein
MPLDPPKEATFRPHGSALVPIKREKMGRGRPPKERAEANDVRQVTTIYLHGALYDRMKAYLREQDLSQTEWLEYLIRTELARRGG